MNEAKLLIGVLKDKGNLGYPEMVTLNLLELEIDKMQKQLDWSSATIIEFTMKERERLMLALDTLTFPKNG